MMDAIRIDRLPDGGFVVTNAGNGRCMFASDDLLEALDYAGAKLEPVELAELRKGAAVNEAPNCQFQQPKAARTIVDPGELGVSHGAEFANRHITGAALGPDVNASIMAQPAPNWVK